MDIARMCQHFKNKGVVGMDIAGPRNDDGSEFAAHREAFEVSIEQHVLFLTNVYKKPALASIGQCACGNGQLSKLYLNLGRTQKTCCGTTFLSPKSM